MSQAIPFTAWEQAVFVGLFIVLVGGILAWVTRQGEMQRKWSEAMARNLQDWVHKRDLDWMGFLREQRQADDAQRCDDRTKLDEMAEAIKALTASFGTHRTEFLTHVADEDARFSVLLTDVQKRRAKEIRKQDGSG